ncbi:MAG: phosphoribosylaminoimidazolesuccinocarboxamide synthase [Christensenellaceae bacterium]|jgi:phosphoribosylaminoimidazole-succinocarboxamide synthase|nr:phosphoribosylaminoimidazolesuccinocarboxamide synthase [Christensenellaceae bacterium]
MEKTLKLYEGKAKKVFLTTDPNAVIVEYKDDATAFNGLKKGTIDGKGLVNNKCSNRLFEMLEKAGIETHLIKELSDTETLVKKVEIVPIEVIVRNIAAGSLSKRLGIPEGTLLKETVLEFCYKNDDLGDPIINDYHIAAMNLATVSELDTIKELSFKINYFLRGFFKEINIDLIDFKLEFGRYMGRIILADEISPDTCRFWDMKTREKLDKDRFRRDMGNVEGAYQEILRRLTGVK